MTLLLSHIKRYGLALVAAVVGVLAVVVKLLLARNSRLSHRVGYAEEKARRAVIIADADIEIERTERKVREEQVKSGNPGIRNPNSLWRQRRFLNTHVLTDLNLLV